MCHPAVEACGNRGGCSQGKEVKVEQERRRVEHKGFVFLAGVVRVRVVRVRVQPLRYGQRGVAGDRVGKMSAGVHEGRRSRVGPTMAMVAQQDSCGYSSV